MHTRGGRCGCAGYNGLVLVGVEALARRLGFGVAGAGGPRGVPTYAGVVRVRVRDGGWGTEAADVLQELVRVIRGACAGGGGGDGGAAASPLPAEPDFPGPGPSPQPEVVMPASSRSYG